MKLIDKIAIITGAASGIGRSAALLFAKEGAKVGVVDINIEWGEETVRIIEEQGGQAIFLETDVSDTEDVQAMVGQVLNKFGKINILVNNAAYMHPGAPIVDLPEEKWYECINTTLTSQYLCSKYVIPEMVKVGGGVIVNVSSIGGVVAFASNPAYCAAKGGVIQLTKAVAVDYAKQNIRANVVCPGAIDTPGADFIKEDKDAYKYSLSMPEMGRWGQPEEIAYPILFLASEESSYLTGSVIVADGGWILR